MPKAAIRSCFPFFALWLAACAAPVPVATETPISSATLEPLVPTLDAALPTPLPTRVRWEFGEPLPYTIQSGDTLAALAAHFNTEIEIILAANPALSPDVTTLPPGLEITIPASFAALLGSAFKIIPDSELVYGPGQADLDLQAIIDTQGGWLAEYQETSAGALSPAWEILQRTGLQYSVNPRLLLAILEYRTGIVTGQPAEKYIETYLLDVVDDSIPGLGGQLGWAAGVLNNGYYGWRDGSDLEITLADGRASRIDPWQNAGTAALHTLFGMWYAAPEFEQATGLDGFAATYRKLFGEPFDYAVQLIPEDLRQPELQLPFLPEKVWAFSGGPHPAWGNSLPYGALDFAPPAVVTGCGYSTEWVAAMAAGEVVRTGTAAAIVDLDGDGDERTGWAILYYHLRNDALPDVGTILQAGDPLGHPSCDGGRATGTHTHVARKYNGEWIPAAGLLPFELSGWVAAAGAEAYEGWLTYDFPAQRLTACPCVTSENHIALP